MDILQYYADQVTNRYRLSQHEGRFIVHEELFDGQGASVWREWASVPCTQLGPLLERLQKRGLSEIDPDATEDEILLTASYR